MTAMGTPTQFSVLRLLIAVTLAAGSFGLIRGMFTGPPFNFWHLWRAVTASLLFGAAIEMVTRRPWLAGCGAGIVMAAILWLAARL